MKRLFAAIAIVSTSMWATQAAARPATPTTPYSQSAQGEPEPVPLGKPKQQPPADDDVEITPLGKPPSHGHKVKTKPVSWPKGLPGGGHVYIMLGNERAELPREVSVQATNSFHAGMKTFEGVYYQKKNLEHQTITWGIVGQHAATVIHSGRPRFAIAFHGMIGVDPGQYIPRLIRLSPYQDLGRLGSTTEFQTDSYQPGGGSFHMHFKDPVVATTTDLPVPGIGYMTVDGPLSPGDYAIVLRPKSETYLTRDIENAYKTEYAGTPAGSTEAWQYAWDFSVRY